MTTEMEGERNNDKEEGDATERQKRRRQKEEETCPLLGGARGCRSPLGLNRGIICSRAGVSSRPRDLLLPACARDRPNSHTPAALWVTNRSESSACTLSLSSAAQGNPNCHTHRLLAGSPTSKRIKCKHEDDQLLVRNY